MFWTPAALVVILAFASVSTYPLVGGITDADPEVPQVKGALQFAVSEVNKENVVYNSEVVKVISATSQVVEGAVYRFEVEMAISGCKPCAQQKCAEVILALAKPYTCYFEVWNAPWLEQPKLMKNECNRSLKTE